MSVRKTGLMVTVITVLMLTLVVLQGTALADCSQSGSTVTCSGSDTDGFSGGSDLTINIQPGATVSDSSDTIFGSDNITINNDGTIIATDSSEGVDINYGTVNNNGTITAPGDAVEFDNNSGPAAVNNNGTITGNVGIHVQDSQNSTIVNNGTVTGNGGTGIQTRGGADNVTNNGTVNGGINLGNGNDSLTIGAGATVTGTMNGGGGTDSLTFVVTDAAIAAQIAAMSPAGGTISFGGRTYTWSNFEQLIALLQEAAGQTVTISFNDGRTNAYDMAAPFAVYCTSEKVDVLDIGSDGQGVLAFSVTMDDVSDAVVQAQANGDSVVIASGLGDTLVALSDGTLLAFGPTLNGAKTYNFGFKTDCTISMPGYEA